MFSALLILVYCCSFAGAISTDPTINEKYIDGTQYTIKSVDTTYIQRISSTGQCNVELKTTSKILSEGEIIKIKNKWFKVEECRLNRAYRVPCGSRLFYQIRDLTCAFVEENNDTKMHVPRRQTANELIHFLDKSSYSICCESACTISELLQYCPTKI